MSGVQSLPLFPDADAQAPSTTPPAPTGKRKRIKPSQLPAATHPWPCVILAVDPGHHAGWALLARGLYSNSGELDTLKDGACADIVMLAIGTAQAHKLPCVLLVEWSPWGQSDRTIAGLAAAVERWLIPWRKFATGNKARVVKVPLSTWRSQTLGPGWSFRKLEPDERALAIAERERDVAAHLVRQFCTDGRVGAEQALSDARCVGPNAYPAICMGFFGSYAQVVGQKLSPSARLRHESRHENRRTDEAT